MTGDNTEALLLALRYLLKVGYNYGWQQAVHKLPYQDDFGHDLDPTQLREPEAEILRRALQPAAVELSDIDVGELKIQKWKDGGFSEKEEAFFVCGYNSAIDHLQSRNLLRITPEASRGDENPFEWWPEETGPKDGQKVELLYLGKTFIGYWYKHPSVEGWVTDEIDCNDYEFEPTHWRPKITRTQPEPDKS